MLSFKPLVDDQAWSVGANFEVAVPDASAGVDGGYALTVYPFFVNREGEYLYVRNVVSPQLNNTRDLVVYIPPRCGECGAVHLSLTMAQLCRESLEGVHTAVDYA